MQAPVLYTLKKNTFWLSAERSLFWEEEKALILSDLHFGKTGHFRKSGIAVPQSVYREDLQRLVSLLHYFQPRKLIVVGDFFHSHANTELDWFKKWREDFSALHIQLVRGNHDILQKKWYGEAAIELIDEKLFSGPFLFTHERCEEDPDHYIFCGHIHPGIAMHGLGRQSLRFPCFYFTDDHCILPAFSRFTGLALIEPVKKDHVFAIVENKLMQLQ